MRHRLEYALMRLCGMLAARAPRALLWRVAGAVASIIGMIHPKRLEIATANLRAAYPNSDEKSLDRMAGDSVRHLLQTVFEFPSLARDTREAVVRSLTISNLEKTRALIARHGRLIFLSAHYGNWELGALSGAMQFGTPFTIVGKPQRNPHVDRYLNRMRERFGNSIVPMEGALRSMMRALEEGRSVALLADQSGTERDVFVPFFNRPAPTTKTVAALSLRLNVPIVIGLAVRQPDLSYVMEIVEVDRAGLVEYSEDNIVELTARHARLLEALIRRAPEQWLWMHRRWKHQEIAPRA